MTPLYAGDLETSTLPGEIEVLMSERRIRLA